MSAKTKNIKRGRPKVSEETNEQVPPATEPQKVVQKLEPDDEQTSFDDFLFHARILESRVSKLKHLLDVLYHTFAQDVVLEISKTGISGISHKKNETEKYEFTIFDKAFDQFHYSLTEKTYILISLSELQKIIKNLSKCSVTFYIRKDDARQDLNIVAQQLKEFKTEKKLTNCRDGVLPKFGFVDTNYANVIMTQTGSLISLIKIHKDVMAPYGVFLVEDGKLKIQFIGVRGDSTGELENSKIVCYQDSEKIIKREVNLRKLTMMGKIVNLGTDILIYIENEKDVILELTSGEFSVFRAILMEKNKDGKQ